MQHDKKVQLLINCGYTLAVTGIIYLCLRYLLGLVLPFILGFAIAFILKPLTQVFIKHWRFRPKAAAFFSAFLFYSLITVILWIFITFLASQFDNFFSQLPALYEQNALPFFESVNQWIISFFTKLSPHSSDRVAELLDVFSNSINQLVTTLSTVMLTFCTNIAKKMPLYLTTFLFTILSSILICLDYQNVSRFVMRQIPKRFRELVMESKNFIVHTVFKMVRAYLILMFITFLELSIGLWALGVDYAPAIALLIALFDLLPILGTGGVMIPWIVFEFLRQDTALAIGLAILYGIITLIRSLIEPKVLSDQIGLNPLVTVTAMFLGLRLFGILGIMLAPLAALLLKHLNDTGQIHLYRS